MCFSILKKLTNRRKKLTHNQKDHSRDMDYASFFAAQEPSRPYKKEQVRTNFAQHGQDGAPRGMYEGRPAGVIEGQMIRGQQEDVARQRQTAVHQPNKRRPDMPLPDELQKAHHRSAAVYQPTNEGLGLPSPEEMEHAFGGYSGPSYFAQQPPHHARTPQAPRAAKMSQPKANSKAPIARSTTGHGLSRIPVHVPQSSVTYVTHRPSTVSHSPNRPHQQSRLPVPKSPTRTKQEVMSLDATLHPVPNYGLRRSNAMNTHYQARDSNTNGYSSPPTYQTHYAADDVRRGELSKYMNKALPALPGSKEYQSKFVEHLSPAVYKPDPLARLPSKRYKGSGVVDESARGQSNAESVSSVDECDRYRSGGDSPVSPVSSLYDA